MAYTYTKIADAGAAVVNGSFAVGDVMQYADNDYIWTKVYGSYQSHTSSMNYLLSNGHITHIDGSTTLISAPDSAATYLRSVVADVTLTQKTIAGFTKAFTLIQEGRTRQLSAEQLLLVVKAAAEAKASINDSDLSATGSTLSASKINDLIVAAKAAVVNQIYGSGVAPESLDQIVEIAQKLTDNDTEFGAFINTLAGKLSVNEAQSLTTAQKTTARTNIDAASTGDVTAAITAAVGDPSTIDIDALANSIVTPFPAALPTA